MTGAVAFATGRRDTPMTLVAARRSRRPGTAEGAITNRVRDYQALEREYVTGTMSLRELCRRHGVTAHSAVVVQARQGNWAEKRQTYRSRASATYIQQHADRAVARDAQVRDHAIEAIDEAITRFRADLKATDRKLIDGVWVDEPRLRVTPRDIALLIDRLQILFGRPSTISEGREFLASVTSEALPVDALRTIVELTRGLESPRHERSPLPRCPSRLGD